MKRKQLFAAVAMAVCLCFALTACSPKETLKTVIIKTCTLLGFVEEDSSEEEDTRVYAEDGGTVTFPEGMDTTESRFVNYVEGDTLFVAFSRINLSYLGSTDFFVAGSDSVTVTSYATTEATRENYMYYKVAVWELADDRSTVSYIPDSTVYFRADGDCRTKTISGLTPGKQYKITLSYDASSVYVTGGFTVSGLGSSDLEVVDNNG